jgi:hypothetical protein
MGPFHFAELSCTNAGTIENDLVNQVSHQNLSSMKILQVIHDHVITDQSISSLGSEWFWKICPLFTHQPVPLKLRIEVLAGFADGKHRNAWGGTLKYQYSAKLNIFTFSARYQWSSARGRDNFYKMGLIYGLFLPSMDSQALQKEGYREES